MDNRPWQPKTLFAVRILKLSATWIIFKSPQLYCIVQFYPPGILLLTNTTEYKMFVCLFWFVGYNFKQYWLFLLVRKYVICSLWKKCYLICNYYHYYDSFMRKKKTKTLHFKPMWLLKSYLETTLSAFQHILLNFFYFSSFCLPFPSLCKWNDKAMSWQYILHHNTRT